MALWSAPIRNFVTKHNQKLNYNIVITDLWSSNNRKNIFFFKWALILLIDKSKEAHGLMGIRAVFRPFALIASSQKGNARKQTLKNRWIGISWKKMSANSCYPKVWPPGSWVAGLIGVRGGCTVGYLSLGNPPLSPLYSNWCKWLTSNQWANENLRILQCVEYTEMAHILLMSQCEHILRWNYCSWMMLFGIYCIEPVLQRNLQNYSIRSCITKKR